MLIGYRLPCLQKCYLYIQFDELNRIMRLMALAKIIVKVYRLH